VYEPARDRPIGARVRCYTWPVAGAKSAATGGRGGSDVEEVADFLLAASRALMGIAVRSVASVEDDVTLVQYRVLVLLTSRGEQNVSELADAIGVHPSTATRLCDRLVAKELVHRAPSSESRREVVLAITPSGRALVRTVTNRRRREMVRVLERCSRDDRRRLRSAFELFAAAAGELELPDDGWKLGWAI